mmetsp:Transcript_29294/g.80487  ORF Transcript_29294/g.80487 Transcript_29294/m.80487 type:complete len:219 (-) Transcript_29294:720-1376(-)
MPPVRPRRRLRVTFLLLHLSWICPIAPEAPRLGFPVFLSSKPFSHLSLVGPRFLLPRLAVSRGGPVGLRHRLPFGSSSLQSHSADCLLPCSVQASLVPPCGDLRPETQLSILGPLPLCALSAAIQLCPVGKPLQPPGSLSPSQSLEDVLFQLSPSGAPSYEPRQLLSFRVLFHRFGPSIPILLFETLRLFLSNFENSLKHHLLPQLLLFQIPLCQQYF